MHRNQFWMLTPRYKNLLSNGNFAAGTSGWSTQNCTLSVAGGVLTITGTTAGLNYRIFNASPIVAGHKYYFSASNLFFTSAIKLITSGVNANSAVQTLSTFSGNVKDAFILLPTLDAAGLRFNFYSNTTVTMSNVIFQDLTATFGAGNEPDLAWCDANIPPRIAY